MSNSIAPGSSADVNVRVTALTTNPNVPVTYKTIILKKNLVNGVNTLTQEMMSATNTKYVVKYDYTLGEDIAVPANCVLEFDGGCINGEYILTGTNTLLSGNIKCFATIAGIFNNDYLNIECFGAKGDGTFDNTLIIQMLLDNVNNPIYIPIGNFAIYNTILLSAGGKNIIIGEDRDRSIIVAKDNMPWMFKANDESADCCPSFRNIGLDGGVITLMDSDTYTMSSYAKGGIKLGERFYQCAFENVYFKNIEGISLFAKNVWYITFKGIWISRCKCGIVFDGQVNGISIKDSWFNIIEKYGIFTCSNLSVRIAFCCFENIGIAGIVTSNGGQAIIENCYFEQSARNGISIRDYDGTTEIQHIKSEIILFGRNLNVEETYFCNGGGNIINAVIRNNDIQKSINGDFIFASNVSGLFIESNVLRGDELSAIFSCIPKTGCRIEDVIIENNIVTHYDQGYYLYKEKWCDINMYSPDQYGTVNNIKTDLDTPFIKSGITNRYFIESNARFVNSVADRPVNAPDGLYIFDKSLNLPIFYDKTNNRWLNSIGKEANSNVVVPITTYYDWDSQEGYIISGTIIAQNNANVIINFHLSNTVAKYRLSNDAGTTWGSWHTFQIT